MRCSEQLGRALAEAERAVAPDPRGPDAHHVLPLAARHPRGQRLGAVEQAHEGVATLRQHPVFCSQRAIRLTLVSTFDPACIRQLEQLLDTLRAAGLPAQ
jgi:hypothetical protein